MQCTLTINGATIRNSADTCVWRSFLAFLIEGRGRRQLEKKREKEEKDQAEAAKKDYQQAWHEIRDTEYPTRVDEMEQFFLTQVSQAETLVQQGLHCRNTLIQVLISTSLLLSISIKH
jgi:hypothetical protein